MPSSRRYGRGSLSSDPRKHRGQLPETKREDPRPQASGKVLQPLYEMNTLTLNYLDDAVIEGRRIPTTAEVGRIVRIPGPSELWRGDSVKILYLFTSPIGMPADPQDYAFIPGGPNRESLAQVLGRFAQGQGPRVLLVNERGLRGRVDALVHRILKPLGYGERPPRLYPGPDAMREMGRPPAQGDFWPTMGPGNVRRSLF